MEAILPAGLAAAHCKFVEAVSAYIKSKQYSISPCKDEVKKWFLLTRNCLTQDQVCIINKLNLQTTPATTTSCTNQNTLSVSVVYPSCYYQPKLYNSVNNTAYPKVMLTANSEFVTGELNYKIETLCGEGGVSTLIGGCTTSCNTSLQSRVFKNDFGFITGISGTAKLTKLPVKTLNGSGALSSTYYLDIDHTTSPYYASSPSCPTCVAVNHTKMSISSLDSDFNSEFAKLRDNISKYLHGTTGKFATTITKDSNGIYLSSLIKHLPINYTGFVIESGFPINYKVGSSIYNLNIFAAGFVTQGATRFIVDKTISTPCGNQLLTGPSTDSLPPSPIATATFYDFKYAANSLYQHPVSPAATYTCISAPQLTGSVANTSNVSGVKWYGPGNTLLSNTYTAIAVTNGIHRFEVTLESGCVLNKTINVLITS